MTPSHRSTDTPSRRLTDKKDDDYSGHRRGVAAGVPNGHTRWIVGGYAKVTGAEKAKKKAAALLLSHTPGSVAGK